MRHVAGQRTTGHRFRMASFALAIVLQVSVIGSVLAPWSARAVKAQAFADSTIAGTVVDAASGLNVAGATVMLYRGHNAVAKALTDAAGRFRFSDQPAGTYFLTVSRNGYTATRSEEIRPASGGAPSTVNVALEPTSTNGLRQIATVSASSTLGNALQTSSTISRGVSSQLLQNENYITVGEGLSRLPGVNVGGTHSSSVGDDLSISLRGFDPSESQALLDGHPIGPIGVQGGGFNFQDSPYYVLRDTNVVFGAGALGLYGTDATGGAIDMQTLDPTQMPELNLTQGIGTLGRKFSSLTATGSVGRFGYAVAGGSGGTYGNFAPQQITQTGLLSGDLSPNAYAANTYQVSGNSNQRGALLKLQYTFAPGTVATVTGYSAQSYQDKTGVGDNDYTPYSLALQNAQSSVDPKDAACPTGVAVAVDNAGDMACYSPARYAAATYGPAGGGADRFKFINNQDYHGRLVTNFQGQSITLDGFIDYYGEAKNSNLTGPPCLQDANCNALFPGATFSTGGFFDNVFKTTGFLVSDDIARGINDFGFGYYTQHQTVTGNVFGPPNYTLLANNPLALATNNIFMRDVFTPAPNVQLFANVWYKLLSTTNADTLDPRATLIVRPTSRDVVRLVAGKTDGEPAAALALQNLTTVFGSINVDCSTLVGKPGNNVTSNSDPVSVGQIGANNLNQETATDYELSFGHAFNGGSSVQLAAYDQHETNLINSLNVPIVPGQIAPALLSGYFGRISSLCGANYMPTLADLSASQAVNGTSSGLFRGLELSGRFFATPRLFFDFSYDLQHAQFFGYSDDDLMGNANLVNGGQAVNFPLNRGTLSADYTSPQGIEARIDSYFFGTNNSLNRGSYGYADGFITYRAPRTRTSLTLGINNIFNSATDNYGRLGLGLQPPLNSFATASPPTPPERYGLLTRSFVITLSQQVR